MTRSYVIKKYLMRLVWSLGAIGFSGNVVASEPLSAKDKALIPIAAFAASGEISQLKSSLHQGLDAGLTINESKAILVQLYAYAGFPRSLNALAALMTVLDERKSQGIEDELGRTSSPFPQNQSSLEVGARNQTKLVGSEVTGALFDFSPEIDTYLKAHLFGDIFQQDVLTWKQREIATISALANMQGVNGQLGAHYRISINNDVSLAELDQFIRVLKVQCGDDVANNAQQVLDATMTDKGE